MATIETLARRHTAQVYTVHDIAGELGMSKTGVQHLLSRNPDIRPEYVVKTGSQTLALYGFTAMAELCTRRKGGCDHEAH